MCCRPPPSAFQACWAAAALAMHAWVDGLLIVTHACVMGRLPQCPRFQADALVCALSTASIDAVWVVPTKQHTEAVRTVTVAMGLVALDRVLGGCGKAPRTRDPLSFAGAPFARGPHLAQLGAALHCVLAAPSSLVCWPAAFLATQARVKHHAQSKPAHGPSAMAPHAPTQLPCQRPSFTHPSTRRTTVCLRPMTQLDSYLPPPLALGPAPTRTPPTWTSTTAGG